MSSYEMSTEPRKASTLFHCSSDRIALDINIILLINKILMPENSANVNRA